MYLVLMNQPGYLPESEPIECDTFDEAKRALIGWLKADEINAQTEESAEEFCFAAEVVNLWSDCDPVKEITISDWVYSIMRVTL